MWRTTLVVHPRHALKMLSSVVMVNQMETMGPGPCLLCRFFIGISVSLSIELLQIYLPTRDSSMTDLICNAIGRFRR